MAKRRGTVGGGSAGFGAGYSRVGTAGTGIGGLGGLAPAPAPYVAPEPQAPAPVAPEPVIPFPTADDMLAVNDWLTNWQTQMEDIDYGISQQTLDTEYTKKANDKAAVEDRSASDEAMAARGIFGSSLQAAAVYDIEATRSLANTYLDSKLNEAITQGAKRKDTLATAKTKFEAGMTAKYGENAAEVNRALNEGYAEQLANYKAPKAAAPSGGGPTVARKTTAPVAVRSGPQAKASVGGKVGTAHTGAQRAGLAPSMLRGQGSKRKPKNPKPKKPGR